MMDSAAFKLIEKHDVIEIYGKGGKIMEGPVLKDSDNRILVAGIYKTIFGKEKGFYQTVGPKDVIRIIKQFDAPVSEGDNSEAIKQKINGAIELLEDANDLA